MACIEPKNTSRACLATFATGTINWLISEQLVGRAFAELFLQLSDLSRQLRMVG